MNQHRDPREMVVVGLSHDAVHIVRRRHGHPLYNRDDVALLNAKVTCFGVSFDMGNQHARQLRAESILRAL